MTDLSSVAGELAGALVDYIEVEGGLEEEMLSGAWEIGVREGGVLGATLMEEVLDRSSDSEDGPLMRRILSSTAAAPLGARPKLAARLATLIVAEPAEAAERVADLEERLARDLLAESMVVMNGRYQPLAAKAVEDEEEAAVAARQAQSVAMLSAVADLVAALIQIAPGTAQMAMAAALDQMPMAIRSPLQEHIPLLAPITDPQLAASALNMAEVRHASRRADWLAALTPELAWSIGAGKKMMDVASKLWSEIIKESVDAEVVERLALEFERLRGAEVWPSTLDLTDLIPSPPEVTHDDLTSALARAEPLRRCGLLDEQQIAAALMGAATAELSRPHPLAAGRDDAGSFVVTSIGRAVPLVGGEAIAAAWDAIRGEDWMPELMNRRARLTLLVAAAHINQPLEAADSVDDIAGYVSVHGTDLAAELAGWVALDPGDDALWRIINAYGRRLPTPVTDALDHIAAEATPQRRLALAAPALDLDPVDERLLELLHFHEADPLAAAQDIVERFENSTKNPDRERALHLWRAMRAKDDDARRLLIVKVLQPMAGLNKHALSLVLRDLELARQPPRPTKGALIKSLRDAGKRFDAEKQVRRALEDMGWSRRAGRFRKRDIDVLEPGDEEPQASHD